MKKARAPIIAGLFLAGIGLTAPSFLLYNPTNSMPVGMWFIHPVMRDLSHGDVVTVCLSDNVGELAKQRGYIGSGDCIGNRLALLKPVAAVPGDTVEVSIEGISVNGQPITYSAAMSADAAGRPLDPVSEGRYSVEPGTVWLVSSHDPRSFDSRYFGPVSLSSIRRVAYPLWTKD